MVIGGRTQRWGMMEMEMEMEMEDGGRKMDD
jgi:hypothetical protein